jgi:hypothetical protein
MPFISDTDEYGKSAKSRPSSMTRFCPQIYQRKYSLVRLFFAYPTQNTVRIDFSKQGMKLSSANLSLNKASILVPYAVVASAA